MQMFEVVALKLLIVDDHEGFRALAKTLMAAQGFDVTGEAADGESAVEVAAELHPDVVLLDINLPGIDGFETARRIAAQADAPAVVLTSSRDASSYGSLVTSSPARGFIPKDELSGEAVE